MTDKLTRMRAGEGLEQSLTEWAGSIAEAIRNDPDSFEPDPGNSSMRWSYAPPAPSSGSRSASMPTWSTGSRPQGDGYQARINAVLRAYVERARKSVPEHPEGLGGLADRRARDRNAARRSVRRRLIGARANDRCSMHCDPVLLDWGSLQVYAMSNRKRVSISLSEEMIAELDRVRTSEERSLSQIVDEALRWYFRRIAVETPTPEEVAAIEEGRTAIERGDYVSFEQLVHELDPGRRETGAKAT